MLGENAIRVLGLDREALGPIAQRIGPTIAEITGRTPTLDPRLVANWEARGGYLRPAEPPDPQSIDHLLDQDLLEVLGAS